MIKVLLLVLGIVTSPTNSVTYTGDDVTSAFPVNFKVQQATDLVITINGTTQTLTSQYTVALLTNTATVNFVTIPPVNAIVTIKRQVPLTQLTNLRTQGS